MIFVLGLYVWVPPSNPSSSKSLNVAKDVIIEDEIVPTYDEHPSIQITSDSEWEEQGWAGRGIEQDPYIIEELAITTNWVCVNITGTTSWFIIRDCLFSSTGYEVGIGVYLKNVAYGKIEECTISRKGIGVGIHRTEECTIEQNDFSNNTFGVYASNLLHCDVSLNLFTRCGIGIGVHSAASTIISHNIISAYESTGISVGNLDNESRVSHNEVHSPLDKRTSLSSIYMSGPAIVECNIISNDYIGIFADSWPIPGDWSGLPATIRNNTIKECDMGIQLSYVGGVIAHSNSIECQQGIYTLGCWASKIEFNRIIVQRRAIQLLESTDCKISNNSLIGGGLYVGGFQISYWQHEIKDNQVNGKSLGYFLNIVDLTVNGHQYGQIIAFNCSGLLIQGGYFHNTTIGVLIIYSNNCILQNSEMSRNWLWGLYLGYSNSCVIRNNIIRNNSRAIYLGGGINLAQVSDTIIERNHIYWNNGTGIRAHPRTVLKDCTIANNAVYNNTGFGILIGYGTKNRVYGNALGWNQAGNTHDSGYDNQWDDGEGIGNWYHDYDSNNSEIYQIPGLAKSVDRFPQLLIARPIRLPLDPDYSMILLFIMISVIGTTGVLGTRFLMKSKD